VFLITNIHTVLQTSRRLWMPTMLGLLLYVLSMFSACTTYAHWQNHPWISPQGLHIANIEAIQLVDTHRCYIATTATIHKEVPLYINVVNQEIYSSVQPTKEGRVVAYKIRNLLRQIRNGLQRIYTKSQNKSLAAPISKIPDAFVHNNAVKINVTAQSPLLPIPANMPTKRKENAWVSAGSNATFSSKSKIHHPTLCAGILDDRHGESANMYMHKSRVCSHPTKTKNKDIYLIRFLLRGPPVMSFNC
jgi:hypothetical protein